MKKARSKRQCPDQRYAARLLFQMRVDMRGDSGKRRTCEDRIINFIAGAPHEAYGYASRYGRRAEFKYENTDGNTVYFEFVGILDLQSLGCDCDPEEVYYTIRQVLYPMESRDRFVPAKRDLIAGCAASTQSC